MTDLATAAGARRQAARETGLLLYDGAAVAARMDPDRDAAAGAMHSAVLALLDAGVPEPEISSVS
jgi:ADP-ribose pyrophosphatase YjhB (NUDIX family)